MKASENRNLLFLIIERESGESTSLRDWIMAQPDLSPVFVSSGVEALLWLGKGNIPDVILADAGMDSLRGPDFIRTLKTSGFFQEIPIIAFGNPELHPVLAGMRQAGATTHIFLPADAETIKERLELAFEASAFKINQE